MENMNKYLSYLLIVGISVFLSFLISEKMSTKIAYVNSVEILKNYKLLKDVREELKNKEAIRQSRIDTLELRLRSGIKKFEESKDKLSRKEFEYQSNMIAKKQRDLLRFQEAMSHEKIEDEKRLTMNAIEPIEKIIKDYAKKNEYDYVLTASDGLLYVNETEKDITEDILQIINE